MSVTGLLCAAEVLPCCRYSDIHLKQKSFAVVSSSNLHLELLYFCYYYFLLFRGSSFLLSRLPHLHPKAEYLMSKKLQRLDVGKAAVWDLWWDESWAVRAVVQVHLVLQKSNINGARLHVLSQTHEWVIMVCQTSSSLHFLSSLGRTSVISWCLLWAHTVCLPERSQPQCNANVHNHACKHIVFEN